MGCDAVVGQINTDVSEIPVSSATLIPICAVS